MGARIMQAWAVMYRVSGVWRYVLRGVGFSAVCASSVCVCAFVALAILAQHLCDVGGKIGRQSEGWQGYR